MNNRSERWWMLVAAAAVALFALPLRAQDDEPKKPDPEVAAKLDAFDDAVRDRKMEQDAEAVRILDELLQMHQAGMHPKDESNLLKSLDKVFKARARKPEQPALYRAATAALGQIGGSVAAQILVKYVEKKPFRDEEWLALQEDMFENIGKAKDERQIEFLVDTATRDPVDGVKRASGKALRHFEGSDLQQRRDIYKKLLRNYAKIEGDSKANIDPGDALVATRKRTLAAIADAWNTTLAALSGQSFRTAEEWQHWWNKNKDDAKAWK